MRSRAYVERAKTREQLTQLANGSSVALMLPSGERIKLGREQLDALAGFTSRMSP
jgi:hypothetical protein